MQKFVTFSRRHGAGIGVMTEEVYRLADEPPLNDASWHLAESAELALARHYEARGAKQQASNQGKPFEYYEHNPQGRGIVVRKETTETEFRFQLPAGCIWAEVDIDRSDDSHPDRVTIYFKDGGTAECLLYGKDEHEDYEKWILPEGQERPQRVTVFAREVRSPMPPVYEAPLIYTYEGLTATQIADVEYLRNLVARSRSEELGGDDDDIAPIAAGLAIDLVFEGDLKPLEDFRT